MLIWTMRALALIGLAGAACGNVESTPADAATDADTRPVACNGGPVDVLPNGDFDAPAPQWLSEPPNLVCGLPLIMPDSGAAAGCLGGGGDGTTSTLSRQISLPAGAISAHLTGRICIATQEPQGVDADIVNFDILDGVVSIGALGRRTNQQGAAACAFASFTLDAPLARDPVTATFRIQATLDVGQSTSFYVDTLKLTVACR